LTIGQHVGIYPTTALRNNVLQAPLIAL
jgi:hypothetical protein